MGDAGYILAGPIGREILAGGTVVFAVFATGGQLLAGQIALANLSDNKVKIDALFSGRDHSLLIPISALSNVIHRNLRHPNTPNLLPTHLRSPILDQHTLRNFHPNRRYSRNGRSRSPSNPR